MILKPICVYWSECTLLRWHNGGWKMMVFIQFWERDLRELARACTDLSNELIRAEIRLKSEELRLN
jgi:hypothetical protein